MLKKIIITVLILLVVIAGAGWYVWSNLDSIVKTAIEKYGSQAVQTSVKLDSVKLSLASGEGSLAGLSIGNPEGFSQPQAFYMGKLLVKLDTKSVTGNGPVIIHEIVIDKPQITYELNNEGKNNLQVIKNNTASFAKSSAAEKSGSSGGKETGRKIIIENLYVRGGQIDATQSMLPQAIKVILPELHLADIGKEGGGATPAQIAELVLGAIAMNASKIAGDEIKKSAEDLIQNEVNKGVEKLGDKLGVPLKDILGR